MRRRTFVQTVTGISVGLSAIVAGCMGSGPVKETNSVEVSPDGFDPKNIHISTEDSVSWENRGEQTHLITSASSNWDFEAELKPGKLVQHQFFEKGVYKVVDGNNGSAEDFTGSRMKIEVGDATIENPVE